MPNVMWYTSTISVLNVRFSSTLMLEIEMLPVKFFQLWVGSRLRSFLTVLLQTVECTYSYIHVSFPRVFAEYWLPLQQSVPICTSLQTFQGKWEWKLHSECELHHWLNLTDILHLCWQNVQESYGCKSINVYTFFPIVKDHCTTLKVAHFAQLWLLLPSV